MERCRVKSPASIIITDPIFTGCNRIYCDAAVQINRRLRFVDGNPTFSLTDCFESWWLLLVPGCIDVIAARRLGPERRIGMTKFYFQQCCHDDGMPLILHYGDNHQKDHVSTSSQVLLQMAYVWIKPKTTIWSKDLRQTKNSAKINLTRCILCCVGLHKSPLDQ